MSIIAALLIISLAALEGGSGVTNEGSIHYERIVSTGADCRFAVSPAIDPVGQNLAYLVDGTGGWDLIVASNYRERGGMILAQMPMVVVGDPGDYPNYPEVLWKSDGSSVFITAQNKTDDHSIVLSEISIATGRMQDQSIRCEDSFNRPHVVQVAGPQSRIMYQCGETMLMLSADSGIPRLAQNLQRSASGHSSGVLWPSPGGDAVAVDLSGGGIVLSGFEETSHDDVITKTGRNPRWDLTGGSILYIDLDSESGSEYVARYDIATKRSCLVFRMPGRIQSAVWGSTEDEVVLSGIRWSWDGLVRALNGGDVGETSIGEFLGEMADTLGLMLKAELYGVAIDRTECHK